MTQEELKRILHYDPKTGMFTWLVDASFRKRKGSPAGSISDGYVNIKYKGKMYRVGRLAWLYVYGTFPSHEIDHKNRIRNDNRIENLECVTRQGNLLNRGHAKGFTKVGSKYVAQITRDGKRIYLGRFMTEEEARKAFVEAKYSYEKKEQKAL